MRRRSAPIITLTLAGALWGRAALAQQPELEGPGLSVERGDGAEGCPDSEALASHIAQIRGRATGGDVAYRVRFSREGAIFRAAVTVEPGDRARTFQSTDTTCDALANAVAVTLALLIDAAEASPPRPPSPPNAPPAPPAPPAPAMERTRPRPARRLAMTASLGGSAVVGVTAPIAAGIAGDAGLMTQRFRVALGVLWTGSVRHSLDPGGIDEQLLAGRARLCFAPTQGAWRADLCSGVLVGSMSATAQGYTRNDTRRRSWVSIPLELAGSFWSGHLGAELGLSALLPVVRSDFSIDGLGVAYASAPVGFMAQLAVVAVAPL
jgi:hypothetical protein